MYNNQMIRLAAKEALGIKERIIGLIGSKKPTALLLKTHFGIHTFGLKFPIDVLILNNKNIVVSLRKGLRPNRIFLWNPKYEKVLELPNGTIKKNEIKIKSEVYLSL